VQSGSGARVCLPTEIAGRQSREAGEPCARSSDCASGVCQDRLCVATCSSAVDCGAAMCRLNVQTSTLLEGAGAWICGEPVGRNPAGALCTSFDPSACESALCHDARCASACGSDSDCDTGLVCRYVTVRGLLGAGRVTACVATDEAAPAPPGANCCTSASCAEGESCRPLRAGESWGMYCQAQSSP
jgi:hypothetical protein